MAQQLPAMVPPPLPLARRPQPEWPPLRLTCSSMPSYVWAGRETASTAATTSMKSVYSRVSHQRLAKKMGNRM